MLDLINADRATEGLSPVQWDDFAAQMGQAHAEEMAANDYMSHWNLAGEGPDIRYGRASGTEWVQENVYMYWWRYDDGRPAPIENWEAVIHEAEKTLMDSPGHRANILDLVHTHVGIGIACNAETGDVCISQEFLNRYITLDSLPAQARVDDTLTLSGQLLSSASESLINLAYELLAMPVTIDWLNTTSTYASPAEFFAALEPGMGANGHFMAQVTLDSEGRPGIYHICIWVRVAGESVQGADTTIEVARTAIPVLKIVPPVAAQPDRF